MITVHRTKSGDMVIEVWDNKARSKSVTISNSKVLSRLKDNPEALREEIKKALSRATKLTRQEKDAVLRALHKYRLPVLFNVSNAGGKARAGRKLAERGLKFVDLAKKRLPALQRQLRRAGRVGREVGKKVARGARVGSRFLGPLGLFIDVLEQMERMERMEREEWERKVEKGEAT